MIIHRFTKNEQQLMLEDIDSKEAQAYILKNEGRINSFEYHMIWTKLEKQKREVSKLNSVVIKTENLMSKEARSREYVFKKRIRK